MIMGRCEGEAESKKKSGMAPYMIPRYGVIADGAAWPVAVFSAGLAGC